MKQTLLGRLAAAAASAFFIYGSCAAAENAEPQWLRVAVHVHTNVSTSQYSPAETLQALGKGGADAVIFTDSLTRRWEFGMWPFPSLIRRVVEQPSVLRYGPERYVREIQELNGAEGSLALPAVEAAPFYYWARTPFDRRGGQIRSWQQHLLVLGVTDPARLAALPTRAFDPYHGDRGAEPYQRFIDAAVDAGGLVFWAHPMTGHLAQHGRIEDFTEPYPHLLKMTRGYHGFALTYLGYLSLVDPGGVWDQVLEEYAAGKRSHPVWVIGELDWRGTGRKPDAVVTWVQVRARTPEAILDAMRQGRMWVAIRNEGNPPAIVSFSVTDVLSSRQATLGQTLEATAAVRVTISGARGGKEGSTTGSTRITLIRNGKVFEIRDLPDASFSADWIDQALGGLTIYRAIVEGPNGVAYTNPIFVVNGRLP